MPSIFHQTAASYISLPPERWRSVEDVAKLEIKDIERAVIFILAVWSGPAVVLLRAYANALTSLDPQDVPLFVVDTDSISWKLPKTFPPNVQHGIGETYFIKNGIIVASVEALLRIEKSTVGEVPQAIDMPSSIARFSRLYKESFAKN